MSTPRLTRGAPIPDEPRRAARPIKSTGLVKIGGVELPPHHAAFLTEYLKRFNGSEAARSLGGSSANYASVAACQILANDKVRAALRGALEERHRDSEHRVDEVARYWWSIATSDPRELSQHVYVPCRHCHGVDHDYQFTDVEQREREREYHRQVSRHQAAVAQIRRSSPDADLPEAPLFFEAGGGGYTTNRYPMRGPDWMEKIARVFSDIGRPLPEGLEANSEHSCPACHGDGIATVWLADTRHLSREAALIFDGVKQTRLGTEMKHLDRADAMVKFQELMGMTGPHRIELSGPGGSPIDVRVQRIESRVVDADYTDVTEEALSRAMEDASERSQLPAPNGHAPAIKTRVA